MWQNLLVWFGKYVDIRERERERLGRLAAMLTISAGVDNSAARNAELTTFRLLTR